MKNSYISFYFVKVCFKAAFTVLSLYIDKVQIIYMLKFAYLMCKIYIFVKLSNELEYMKPIKFLS